MNKKELILATATQLFSENGFANTSMSEICHVANVSKGLVYHHFKSKNEILEEIFRETTEQMKAMGSMSPDDSPKDQLLTLINNFFAQLEADALTLRLNLNVMFQASTRALLQEQMDERSSILFSSVKKIFDQIDKSQSQTLSYMFIAELDGIALSYLSVFKGYPLEDVKQHLLTKYQNLLQ